MVGKKLETRIYHDGKGEGYTFKYPRYTLFEMRPDQFDREIASVKYSVVAEYDEDGDKMSNWLYDDEKVARECFKLMAAVD